MTEAPGSVQEISMLQSSTLAHLVQREIERLIMSGGLRTGERINEVIIARTLGVSRGPVREALRTLEEMGLVQFEKNRGVTVREISAQDAADIYEIRAAIEALACRRAALSMSDDQIDEFQALVEGMEKVAAAADIERYHPLNIRFHERLIEIASSIELTRIYRILLKKLTLFRRRTLGQDGAVSVSTAEHRLIVQQLASRNSTAAAMAMHDHIMASSRRMQQGLLLYFQSKPADQPQADVGPGPSGSHWTSGQAG